jgi:hypothetical protein
MEGAMAWIWSIRRAMVGMLSRSVVPVHQRLFRARAHLPRRATSSENLREEVALA